MKNHLKFYFISFFFVSFCFPTAINLIATSFKTEISFKLANSFMLGRPIIFLLNTVSIKVNKKKI